MSNLLRNLRKNSTNYLLISNEYHLSKLHEFQPLQVHDYKPFQPLYVSFLISPWDQELPITMNNQKNTLIEGVHKSTHKLQLHLVKDVQYVRSQLNSLINIDIISCTLILLKQLH